MKNKTIYLILAILGFIAPTILVVMESIETGSILLYTDPLATMEAMFANRISTIFMIDLLFAVFVFFIWSYKDERTLKVTKLAWLWLVTMMFGLAGAFPLYLYLRENGLDNDN